MTRLIALLTAAALLAGCDRQNPRPGDHEVDPGSRADSPQPQPAATLQHVEALLARGENAAALEALERLSIGADDAGRTNALRAEALLALRRYEPAAAAAREAAQALFSIAGESARDPSLARAWRVLAECDLHGYRVEDAAAHLASATAAAPDDPAAAALLARTRARIALTRGDVEGAGAAAESAVSLLEEAKLTARWEMGVALATRAAVWRRIMDKVNRTPDEFAAAARLLIAARSADDPEVVETVETALGMLEAGRRFADAAALVDEWIRAVDERPGALRPWAAESARCRRAHGLVRESRFEEALQELSAAMANPPADAPDARVVRVLSLVEAADIHRRMGHLGDAHILVDRALAVFAGNPVRDAEIIANAFAQTILGWMLIDEGDFPSAEPVLMPAVDALRATAGEGHWRTGLARALLGETRMRQGRFDDAEEDLAYGSRILITQRGPDTDAYRAIRMCAELYDAWGKPELASFYRERLPFSENSPASPD